MHLALALSVVLCADAPGVIGRWSLPDRPDVIVEVREVGATLQAVVVAAPDAAFVGQQLLRGVTFDAKQGHWAGEFYAPRRKLWIQATLRVDGDALLIEGSLGPLSKSVRWRRAP